MNETDVNVTQDEKGCTVVTVVVKACCHFDHTIWDEGLTIWDDGATVWDQE